MHVEKISVLLILVKIFFPFGKEKLVKNYFKIFPIVNINLSFNSFCGLSIMIPRTPNDPYLDV